MQVDFITALFIGTNVIKETRNVVIQKRRFIDHQYSNDDLIIILLRAYYPILFLKNIPNLSRWRVGIVYFRERKPIFWKNLKQFKIFA